MTRTISTETPPSVTSTSETNGADGNAPQRRAPLPVAAKVGIVAAIVLAGYLIWSNFVAPPKIPHSMIALSGRIEGDDSAVAPKTTGRILEVRFREGDSVKAGETIAVLDDEQVFARTDQARAAVTVAEARLRSSRDQIAVLQEQLQQNDLQTEQAKLDASGRVRQAEADVAAAESDLANQEAAFQIADFDRTAYNKLRKTDAVSERQARQANATAEQQAAAVAAAKRRLEAARGVLTMAQATLSNPEIRGFQASTVRKQLAQQRSEIAYSQALADQARVPAYRSPGHAQRSDGQGALRRHGDDAGGGAGRGGAGRDGDCDPAGSKQGISKGFYPRRADRQSQGRPAGAYLPGLRPGKTPRRVRGAHRSAGHLYPGKYLLPRRPGQASSGGKAESEERHRVRQAGHAGGWRDPGRRQHLAARPVQPVTRAW